MSTVKLGDKVRDSWSGFEGRVISTHHYLHGCIRISVQPYVGTDNVFNEAVTFDEPQLEILEPAEKEEVTLLQQEDG